MIVLDQVRGTTLPLFFEISGISLKFGEMINSSMDQIVQNGHTRSLFACYTELWFFILFIYLFCVLLMSGVLSFSERLLTFYKCTHIMSIALNTAFVGDNILHLTFQMPTNQLHQIFHALYTNSVVVLLKISMTTAWCPYLVLADNVCNSHRQNVSLLTIYENISTCVAWISNVVLIIPVASLTCIISQARAELFIRQGRR